MTTYSDYGPILPANTPRDGGERFRIPPEMQAILNQPGIQSGDKSEQLLKLYSQSKFVSILQPGYVIAQYIASLRIIRSTTTLGLWLRMLSGTI